MKLRPGSLRLGGLALLSGWLMGCAPSSDLVTRTFPPAAPYEWHLREPVAMPRDRARIHLQNGQSGVGFNSYEPSCTLEIRVINRDAAEIIQPDVFMVEQVQHLFEEVVEFKQHRLAALAMGGGSAMDAGPAMIHEGYHFWLKSPRQPNVLRLTCRGLYAEPHRAHPPSMEEIQHTLGSIGYFRFPE